MGGKNTILTKFPLAGTKNGMISFLIWKSRMEVDHFLL